MHLKLDTSKTYAIALEGGGAKGAYEIGVWQALEEAGIKYNAVSGTSVGALNGALMAMRDLPRAVAVWSDMRLSKVIDMSNIDEEALKQVMNGDFELGIISELIPQALELIKNRGLDVAPLRAWVREVVDVEQIKRSDVALFVSTVSLTDRKALEIKINDLPENEICNMLLASAYHPSFRLEKLGGKLYADGGLVDNIPLHALVENGCKDIIAVRIPSLGVEKRFKMPDDVSVTTIHTNSDLGFVLNFDAELSKRNMFIGYMDAKRVLYGLYGQRYYIDRSMSDREALSYLIERMYDSSRSLRSFVEHALPKLAKKLSVEDGDYYELLIAAAEAEAERKGIEHMKIYIDTDLLSLIEGE